jgi:glycine/D-amino acid oxidase-like deaminating enzyme
MKTFDVAIVGGGITGVATAYFLAPRGISVVLFERGEIASGATARNPGLVLTGLEDHYDRLARGVGRERTAEVWRATVENGRLVGETIARHKIECGYERCGSYALATLQAEADDLAESIALMAEDRVEARAVHLEKEALAREPLAPRGLAAIRFEDDAALDAAAFVRGLAATLAGRVEILTRTEVRTLEADAGSVRLETARGEVRAAIAVLATNAEAARLHPFFAGRIVPVRGQGFVTAPGPRALARGVTASFGHEHYRQLPGGEFVAAGVRPDPSAEEITTIEAVTDEFQGFLRKFAAHRVPGIPADLFVERRFSSIAACTQDGLPIVGPVPGLPTLVAACGFAMRGLSLGMAIGKALAALIVEGKKDYPRCFGAGRFL